jgi:uncharacterized coiled-coil DUF342 family protein
MNFYNKLINYVDKLKKRNENMNNLYIETKESVNNLNENIKNLNNSVDDYINAYKSYMTSYNKYESLQKIHRME